MEERRGCGREGGREEWPNTEFGPEHSSQKCWYWPNLVLAKVCVGHRWPKLATAGAERGGESGVGRRVIQGGRREGGGRKGEGREPAV